MTMGLKLIDILRLLEIWKFAGYDDITIGFDNLTIIITLEWRIHECNCLSLPVLLRSAISVWKQRPSVDVINVIAVLIKKLRCYCYYPSFSLKHCAQSGLCAWLSKQWCPSVGEVRRRRNCQPCWVGNDSAHIFRVNTNQSSSKLVKTPLNCVCSARCCADGKKLHF